MTAKLQIAEYCLLWLMLFAALQPEASGVPAPAPQTAKDFIAVVGESTERDLSAGQLHSYPFELSPGKFFRIDFYSYKLDLFVSMAWPGSKRSLEWSIPKRVTAPISFVADVQGTYQLTVRSSERITNSGVYRMGINALRPAAPQDKKQVVACKRLSNATQFLRQWTEASLKNAIDEYEKAVRIWEAVGDRAQEAATLENAGNVWEILSGWQKAFTCYKEAQVIYDRLKDHSGTTKIANAISALLINQGQYQKVLEIYTPEQMAIEDPWEKAQILHNTGAAYYGMSEWVKAEDFLNSALKLRERIQDTEGQADTLLYLGYARHAGKELSSAEQYYRQSLHLWQAAENPRGIALALTALGHLSNLSGERQRALEYYDRSLQMLQTIGDLSGRYNVLGGIAYLYAGLGEKEKALHYYLKALDLARLAKDLAEEASDLNFISAIYMDLGDFRNALRYSQQSVLVNRSMPSTLGEAYALETLGKALVALGKQEDAMKNYEQALELSRKGSDRFLEGLLFNGLGQLHFGSGRLQEAIDCYRQALSLQQNSKDSVRMPATLYNLARAEREAGNLDNAIQYADQGLKIAESLRGKVASHELRGAYLASVHQQYEFMIDSLMRLHGLRSSEQSIARALQTSEMARARSLLESLVEARADIRQGADPVLLEQERSLQKSLNAKAERKMQLLGREHSVQEEAAIAEEISAITEEYERVQAQIRSRSPHYAALTQPQPLDLPGIQQMVMDDETLLLEYSLGEEQSWLWAVTPTTIQGYELPRRAEIEARANRVREFMLARQRRAREAAASYQQRIRRADGEYQAEAEALGRMLLGPVAERLESQRLLIVSDGALQYLPFGALPKPGRQGNGKKAELQPSALLIEDHEIVHLPSASVLAVIRQETSRRPLPPKTLVVLADPVFEADDPRVQHQGLSAKPAAALSARNKAKSSTESPRALREIDISDQRLVASRLLATREEADAIMALVPEGAGLKILGFDANKSLAMGPELGRYRIVHFATHGFIDSKHPELSALVLSLFDEQGRPQDGYLRLHDIYNLRLPVELVVLSACSSALGKDVRGEGLVGIVRGFMYAGAARVLASLWKVEDDATAALMKLFYQKMLQEGLPPVTALRMAQLDIRKQKRWQSPYYWAAFVLQGEWK
ncbi:MAG: CHAT domain-containing protein [Acidobacteria bacterium]|nr:CHAT domain-containing protein [Acidobacteriota bacterium]